MATADQSVQPACFGKNPTAAAAAAARAVVAAKAATVAAAARAARYPLLGGRGGLAGAALYVGPASFCGPA